MTQHVGLGSSTAPFSSFSIASAFHSLTSKVNGVFGIYLTVALGFSVYYGNKWYQFHKNPYLQLDDDVKGVKCRLLLKEIENQLKINAEANVTAVVQECEALQASMAKKDPIVSQGLVDYYARKDPNEAFRIADGLLFEKELFDACESIHMASPEFDRKALSELLKQAYESCVSKHKNPIAEVKRLLKYARLAHSIDKNSGLTREVLEAAISAADRCGGGLAQANVYCEIDKVCEEFGSSGICIYQFISFVDFLSAAKNASEQASKENSTSKTAFEAHLALAKAQLLCRENNQVALARAIDLFNEGKCQDFELLASVYAESGYLSQAIVILDQVFKTTKEDDAETYLRLESAYQKHEMLDVANGALTCAQIAFASLPEETEQEIESKFHLLEKFSSWKIATDKLIESVLGSRWSYYRASSDETQQKILFQHIQFYNGRRGFEEHMNALMNVYLTFINASKQSACDKIIDLTNSATTLSPEQGTRMLGFAENCLPQVPSCNYAKMTAKIAEAYLSMNTAKSHDLLDNYAKSQAWNHGLSAVIPVIAIPIVRAYPMAGLVCLAAYTIQKLFSK